MSFNRWLKNLRSAMAQKARHNHRRSAISALQSAANQPHLEPLEDRCLMAFFVPVDYPVAAGSDVVVSADFNRDGRLDLASAGGLLLGNGDATFQPALSLPPIGCSRLATGDFNGDGNPDLVGSTFPVWGFVGETSILLGNGDGTFAQPIAIGDAVWTLTARDVNGDGKDDLVTTWQESDGENYNIEHLNVLLSNGDGTFVHSWNTVTAIQVNSVAIADFDGNGSLDLAIPDQGSVGIWLGSGSGAFQDPTYFYAHDATSVIAADFNGDDKPDLASDSVILVGNGDGTFQPALVHPGRYFNTSGFNTGFAAGDFDGDGNRDLAMTHSNYGTGFGAVTVFGGTGDGTLGLPMQFEFDIATRAMTAADFNGDGFSDVAAASGNSIVVLVNDANWPAADAPSVSIRDATVTEGNTGTQVATFTVSLSAASDEPVTIAYATADGSAAADSDYQAASSTLTIPAGETTGTITVLVNGDVLFEPDETFVVNLSSQTNATIADGQGLGTIVNNDYETNPPRITIDDVHGYEGNTGTTPFVFNVSLSNTYTAPVSVKYGTANGSATTRTKDYKATSGTLTFTPGETSKTITVLAIGDRRGELNETFAVNLRSATNATIEDSRGVGIIMDDEPRLTVSDGSILEGQSNMAAMVFTVTLSAAYDQPVTFSFATGNGSAKAASRDYKATSGNLTFAPGETSKTITVWVYGDTKIEGNESLYLNLSGVTNSLISRNRGAGTILNDD